jgi:hypothetical protein
MKIGTPHNIELLLHYHTTPDVHPRFHVAHVKEVTEMFVKRGCIIPEKDKPDQYRTTSLGAAWVKALCNTEIPVAVFVDQTGAVIS